MASANNAIWQSVLSRLNPSWHVEVTPGVKNLSAFTTQIYAIDSSTGWIAAGSIQPDSMREARSLLDKDPDAARATADTAGAYLAQCSDTAVRSETEEGHVALQATVFALTQTQVFDQVMRSPEGPAGHWLYLLYRLKDNTSILARPIFFRSPGSSYLAVDLIASVVKRTLEIDLSPGTKTGTKIRVGGGVKLAAQFKV